VWQLDIHHHNADLRARLFFAGRADERAYHPTLIVVNGRERNQTAF